MLDNLRCSLKKENQDKTCDSGSKYVEALSFAVDTLILKHLQRLLDHSFCSNEEEDSAHADDITFEASTRTKLTLFSGESFESKEFYTCRTCIKGHGNARIEIRIVLFELRQAVYGYRETQSDGSKFFFVFARHWILRV